MVYRSSSDLTEGDRANLLAKIPFVLTSVVAATKRSLTIGLWVGGYALITYFLDHAFFGLEASSLLSSAPDSPD